MFNRDFAKTNKEFQEACERAQVKPTKRQASRWHQKRGQAYTQGRAKPEASA